MRSERTIPRRARRDRDPEVERERMADEHDAGLDLVGEAEHQCEVEVEVHGPPGLVLHRTPHRRDRRHARQDESTNATVAVSMSG